MKNKWEALKEIDIEDFIWLINFFIIIAAVVSNQFERDYIKNNNKKAAKTYKNINIVILIVAFGIYFYTVYQNKKSLEELQQNATKEEVLLNHISYIASLLFLVAGALFLIREIFSKPGEPLEDPFF